MPKIRSFTPAWLSTDSTDGRGLFASSAANARKSSLAASTASPHPASAYGSPKKQAYIPGPKRTIARRGTEVFVANGREIRWADLVTMKDAWETTQDGFTKSTSNTAPSTPAYRTLKPPVASDIRQLVISPQANYMAILTTHTVHICVLPDPSHLVAAQDPDVPLKTRYFTLGPTTHVTTRQPVVSALWHPLGVNGSAIVTITRDAVVRLWEISPVDRWSFDAPSLSIDVKKLADGTWLDQDFGASANTNTGYSPDFFDMEVAAACFGPRSSGGWSSMTLYLAMLGGDVYALCPLLPKRFAPPTALIPSLSVAIVSNLAAVEDDPNTTPRARQLARQQLDWMTQIDNQEPTIVDSAAQSGHEPPTEIYTRPSNPSIVPRLQGPLEVDLDDESDDEGESLIGELCDIFVIGERIDTEFLTGDDDEGDELQYEDLIDREDQEGLSLPVICLISTTGKLHICLDLVGVEAQWLPHRGHHAHKSSLSGSILNGRSSSTASLDTAPSSARPLLTFQVVDVVRGSEQRPGGWCTFSPDVTSRYSFYITHPGGITNISLSSWVFRLEQELQESTDTGADFRVRQLVTGENTQRQRVYTHNRDEALATCTSLLDPDLGYFLLSATEHAPVAICFESPEGEDGGFGGAAPGFGSSSQNINTSNATTFQTTAARSTAEEAEDKAVLALDFWKARPAFETPPELLAKSELSQAKNMLFSSRYQMLQHQEVRLSPATLAIFTNAHKLVGKETGRLNHAAAQMFTKLEDLPIHLREQVESTYTLKRRIDMIAGEDQGADNDQDGGLTDDVRLRQRLQQAQDRHKALTERMERLRRTFGRASARPLSDKERVWSQEVQALDTSLQKAEAGAIPSEADSSATTNTNLLGPASPSKAASDIGLRVVQIRGLWDDLSKQADGILQKSGGGGGGNTSTDDIKSSVASLVSVNSRTSTPSPPASVTGSTAGAEGKSGTAASSRLSHALQVPADVRKAKMAQVTKLLERETAMVEAVTERLERLGVTS
ncbi:uncharacterized protein SPSK_08442 [Sporothrix schenckii 1099-18]|uniref:Nuclear pore complex protein An-Nup82 n=1 Tax=Sporothrix schenckii 1099-18 TaxID=1397361 RepID=A0A0F2MCG4_SPOSC|nr:uncharacterized protein SPSK_08442 [Sporothrix schenckii 1099-18]KJR85851.1 hypothetical protein SPSK_08442 [Sporothrix schenckii 1099-18]